MRQDTIGPYRVLDEIGRGGMAVVYRAHDPNLDREIAVKVLHEHLADSEEARRRFRREARAVAALDRHPNIIDVYACSADDDRDLYIATEYVRGVNLKQFVDRHPICIPELGALLVVPIARGLSYAHERGIIHRDIKPENVMVRDDGVLKIMDFGIAHVMDAQRHLTQTGAIVGSPAYMSPEHIDGKALDPRADVFSVGTLLYFLTTGKLPFEGETTHSLLRNILEGRHESPRRRNPLIGERLAQIIETALQARIEKRYQNIDALLDDLLHYLAEEGYADPEKALKVYLADPDGYHRTLQTALGTRLLQRARVAVRQGHLAQALDLYNRVLVLDESNEAVLQEVARLSGKRRRGRMLRYAMLALLVLGLSVGVCYAIGYGWQQVNHERWQAGARFARNAGQMAPALWEVDRALRTLIFRPAPPESPPPPDGVANWDGRRRWAYGSPIPDVVRYGRMTLYPKRSQPDLAHWYGSESAGNRPRGMRPRWLQPEIEISPLRKSGIGQRLAGMARTVTVRLDVDIPAVAIYLGDQLISKREPIALKEGRHTIRLVHSGNDALLPDLQTLELDADRPPVGVVRYGFRVRYKPATLLVKASPRSRVALEGLRHGGWSDQPLLVEMGSERQRRVKIRVTAPAHDIWETQVDLLAGQKTVVTATLRASSPTPENR